MTYDEALKAMKEGAIAGFVAIGIGLVTMYLLIHNDMDKGPFAFMNDPWTIVSMLLYLLCTMGVLYKSRTAAVCLFLMFTSDKILLFMNMKKVGILPIMIALCFMYYFWRAVHGSFVYHKLKKIEKE